MNDLIDRNELLNVINNIQITIDLPLEEMIREDVDLDFFTRLVQDAVQANNKMVIDTIKNQPTAYSVNKVIEELKEMIHPKQLYFCKYAKGGCKHLDNNDKDCMECAVENVIEIVKQGGASDDVCEWKQDNMCETVYRVCGGFSTTAYQTDFEFCPYCGKKIKIVGDCLDKNKWVVRIDIKNMDSIKDKIEEYAKSQYNKAIDECNKKLDELEINYESCFGTKIIEMYADVYEDFRAWLRSKND